MRAARGAVAVILLTTCGGSLVQFTTTAEVRAALAPDNIECRDFAWNPPAAATACSFAESIPQDGLRSGVVVIYANESDLDAAVKRCAADGDEGGQLLYRDGQRWVSSIAAYAGNPRTARDIDDQSFVERVARLLGTDVMDC